MDREGLPPNAAASASCYELLFHSLASIPISHYFLASFSLLLIILYNFLDSHFLHDLLTLFSGDPVTLTYNSGSDLCQSVVSMSKILRGRYLVTPWLSSPHFQTAFLTFLGRAPPVTYRRRLFRASDGGTIALDWLTYADVLQGSSHVIDSSTAPRGDNKTPIVILIPGLSSDSASSYARHLAFKMARKGWNFVVSNHRGLGGVSLTSDRCYNAGWTEDIRNIIDHIRCEYPEAPLYAVGTSMGANVLVKYLGEDGMETPLTGAAAICCPWDLLVCARFMDRRPVQKTYNRVIANGLRNYAQLHQSVLSRLTDWEGIKKSRSFRDFDDHVTRVLGNFETVDTYYRRSSSTNYVENVSVPLLCINALDDPLCTSEAIPFDECRINKNIMLATTPHGGHLAFFEGITACSLWWVRAADEFFGILNTGQFSKGRPKMQNSDVPKPLQSSNDEGHTIRSKDKETISGEGTSNTDELYTEKQIIQQEKQNVKDPNVPVQGRIDKLSGGGRPLIRLLACIAITTSWPFVGSFLLSVFKRRF